MEKESVLKKYIIQKLIKQYGKREKEYDEYRRLYYFMFKR